MICAAICKQEGTTKDNNAGTTHIAQRLLALDL